MCADSKHCRASVVSKWFNGVAVLGGLNASAGCHARRRASHPGCRPALCVYRDLRVAGDTALAFEASFRSADARSVLVGLGSVRIDGAGSATAFASAAGGGGGGGAAAALAASSGLGARCAMRGDGTLLLTTDDGNVFEARSGIAAADGDDGRGTIAVRLDELLSKVHFTVNNDAVHTVPLQVPRAISGAQTGFLVPFVSLPRAGDEVVMRAPAR